ncbi:4'-phosphopantetheinyl transferase family protein [Granulosicoccus sp. 3-233]|uniref:4'-phosphopantetheinyl transferase family protein n=1 Tax=Granulosicoccus sp. 3-233 TaxID=3417969 RepID=UPI003D34CC5E
MSGIGESIPNPINGLTYAPEWAGTNVYLACCEVGQGLDELYPEEWNLVSASAPLRRRTFASGRYCARAALAEAGLPAVPLLRATDGAVVWPEGVIGSVSHTNEWAVAAVAIRDMSDALSLGVDLERIQELGAGVLKLVATAGERAELAQAGSEDWQATALFSLKESLYKCLRPVCGRFIEFAEVEISDIVSGRPRVSLQSDDLANLFEPSALNLRMAVTPGHVFTLAWLRTG